MIPYLYQYKVKGKHSVYFNSETPNWEGNSNAVDVRNLHMKDF